MNKENVVPKGPIEIIRVSVHRSRGGWYEATSFDLPGLYVANPDISAVFEDIPLTIKALYKAQYDVDVVVMEGAYRQAHDTHELPWLTVPPDITAAQFAA